MKANKSISGIIVLSIIMMLLTATSLFAQPQKASLDGSWSVKYADGSEGVMTVEKNTIKIKIPEIGEIKGMVQASGDYFESIMSERRNGINFLFGYLKGGKVDGKLQERMPCAELNKAFKSGVATMSNTCQASFTAVKK